MLGRRLASKGDFAAAEQRITAVIADVRHSPDSDRGLPEALDALGSLYRKMGRNSEWIAVYRELLPLTKRTRGPEHWEVGIVSYNLASALESAGSNPEALAHSENAVRIGTAAVGHDHNFSTAARILRARLRCKLSGSAGADRDEHAALALLVARYPNYRDRLVETRALCGLPMLAP